MIWMAILLVALLLVLSTLCLGINIGRLGLAQVLKSQATSHVSLFFLILGLIAPTGVLILSLSPDEFLKSAIEWAAKGFLADNRDLFGISTALNDYGRAIPWAALIGGFAYGYSTRSVHSHFNKMRRTYEGLVNRHGYWFTSPWPQTVIDGDREKLGEIEKTYSILLAEVDTPNTSVDRDEALHQAMVLLHQRALLRASLRNYHDALNDVRAARSTNGADSGQFSKEYAETAASQQMFLEAELLIALNTQLDLARTLLLKAREIDEKYYDANGIDQINHRLEVLDTLVSISSPYPTSEM